MKILHVGKYFHPFRGGLESYMRDLMVAVGRRGIEGTALVHRHEWSILSVDETVALGGQDFRVIRAGTWVRLLYTPISPVFPWLLRRLIRALQPDILHLHLPNPSAFWALLLPSARRIPWVVHWQSDVITESQGGLMKLAYAVYRPFEQALLKHAAAIITGSPDYRDSSEPLQRWLAKCRAVPLGLDEDRLAKLAGVAEHTAVQAKNGPDSGLRILAIGRLTYYKGFRYLVEAVAQSDDLQLDLVGEGDQSHELRQLAAALGMEQRVRFHGRADDAELARLLAACDCLCLPSVERTEAFGMVLLEAMSFGKATVVSDVPGSGMGWIVDHGVTGLKVKPADAGALAAALRELATDHERLRQMGRAGREKFERLFQINHAVEGVIDTYRAVLGENAGPAEESARP